MAEQRQPVLFGDPPAAGTSTGASSTGATATAAEPPAAFEDLVSELERLVGQLEAGQLSLEDSLVAFERGMHLSKRAAGILDAAERRIEQLTGTPDAPVLKPLDDAF